MMAAFDVSVICPITRHAGDLARVHQEFRQALATLDRRIEFIYVVPRHWPRIEAALSRIDDPLFPVRILRLATDRGEAVALQVGFEHARAPRVLTIPDRLQIDAEVAVEVVRRLEAGDEFVVTRREPRSDAMLNRFQSRVFHSLVKKLVWVDFRDMTCGLRGMSTEAARKLDLYGDQHRFIPVIGVRCGYDVVEIPGAQHPENRELRIYGPGVYVRRLLDVLNIFFLTRFTRKPLRFFGLMGTLVGLLGAIICVIVTLQRHFLGVPLTSRPLLLLGVLLIVLGVQVVSVGLLGEIIIFLASRRETPVIREVGHAERRPAEVVAARQGDGAAGSR